ncbi:hypothetical protein CEP52_003423 [Fusarium oligoseptatum]|uniref:Uncharacterized protein n=1 Tax=Fusarium oligoseptatum TaxID=2604345 RepID=A0A428U981_9HYPO|nr:hypothetical protein CEP52_003423 [Fusarium oligoseptatum]
MILSRQSAALRKHATKAGIPIPRGIIAQTVDETKDAIKIPRWKRGLHPFDDSVSTVSRLYIEETFLVDKEWHIAMTINRENYCPVIRLKRLEISSGNAKTRGAEKVPNTLSTLA